MNNGICAWIRKFLQHNVIVDNSLPERPGLDGQDMPRQQRSQNAPVSGVSVAQLPPLGGRHSAFPRLQSSGRLKGRRAARVHRASDASDVNEKI
ncbi:hypothetical protein [Arthrobacter sp. D1-17]